MRAYRPCRLVLHCAATQSSAEGLPPIHAGKSTLINVLARQVLRLSHQGNKLSHHVAAKVRPDPDPDPDPNPDPNATPNPNRRWST